MSSTRKRDLIREYKEREKRAGIFALRCAATGEVWVAASRDLGKQENGIRFQLKMGSHMNKALQAAWNANGEDAFAFEVLEEIKDDNALLIPSLLKDRLAHWLAALGARKLVG